MTVVLAAESISAGVSPGALLLGVVLLLANGFFVAAEIALLAAKRVRIDQLADAGDPRAIRAQRALSELSVTFTGAQLGVTMCSLGLGAVAEPALASTLLLAIEPLGLPTGTASALAFVIGLSAVVFLHMVLGEMVPKNLALVDAERLALRVSTGFSLFERVFRPLILVLNALANGLVRLVGVEPVAERDLAHTPDELRMELHESLRHGQLAPGEVRVLSAVLALGDIDAEAAMTPRVDLVTVPEDAPVEQILDVAAATGYTRLPVRRVDVDHIVGLVHVKDLLIAEDGAFEGQTAADVMRPITVVPESRDLDLLLSEMRHQRSHLALVIDEYGGTAGVLTLEDVLEELVGDIADEFDTEEDARPGPDGTWVVDGTIRRDELERLTGLVLPEGESETLSGALSEILERLPEVGDRVTLPGWEIEVVSMDGLRAGTVHLTARE